MATSMTNGLQPDAAFGYVRRVEALRADLEKEKSAFVLRCKPIQEAIRQVLDDAKAAGIRKKALKTKVKTRELLTKAVRLESQLEEDDRENYELLDDAIPGLDDLPLGIVALEKDRAAGRTKRPSALDALDDPDDIAGGDRGDAP